MDIGIIYFLQVSGGKINSPIQLKNLRWIYQVSAYNLLFPVIILIPLINAFSPLLRCQI